MPNDAHHDAQPTDDHAQSSVDTTENDANRDEPGAPEQPAERFDPNNRPKEYGGPKGPDPVRYGDWEKNGRCIDF